ncbi:MAG TPA: AarF/UbiB family protein [Verrucomicrobiae bacterium]|jgi:predicted unusual protein kinase regulating ubiquinone biosynthesis (AarF/ABC1/UbiB family)|nr:AarF/UbiB family protein [Verrucomicrobiae bacterium]
MKFSLHYLKRYKDIAFLLAKYSQSGTRNRFGFDQPTEADGQTKAHELPDDLERLGPTFVKLGQLLSSRADLLPEGFLKPLSRLQDKVKPFPYQDVEFIVENELGAKISKLFSHFEQTPMAAASLGQVHRAALHDGRPVAVKVQRPNIHEQIREDFAALEEIAKLLHRHTEFGQRHELVKVLEEFETTIAHELDYRREAANMVTLSNNLKEFKHIRIPLPIDKYTTHKVLTMDYIDGTKITELSPLASLDLDGRALAEELFQAYLKQVLLDGTFHADPHPGNVFLTTDRCVALIDLGMVGYTTPTMQDNLLKLLLAVSEGDSDEAADMAIRMSDTANDFDETQFRHKIGQLVAEQLSGNTLGQMDLGKTLLAVSRSAADNGLYVPIELTLLGKTLLQLDEVGQALSPDFDPNESIRRNAGNILNRRVKSTLTEGKIFSSLLETKQFISALPSRLNKILDAVGNAELNVNVKPSETNFLIESFQKVANRITSGLLLASLIIGAALLMRVETNFHLFGYPGLAILCFIFAAAGAVWLLLNILWQDHKSKRQPRR